MGFEFTSNKELVRNDLQAIIKPIGHNIWRSSVERLECRPVQNRPLNPVRVDSVKEESIQKVVVSCVSMMNEPTDTQVNKS